MAQLVMAPDRAWDALPHMPRVQLLLGGQAFVNISHGTCLPKIERWELAAPFSLGHQLRRSFNLQQCRVQLLRGNALVNRLSNWVS